MRRWTDRAERWREEMERWTDRAGRWRERMERWREGMERWTDRAERWREGEDGRRGSGGFRALINHSHFPTTRQTIRRKWDSCKV